MRNWKSRTIGLLVFAASMSLLWAACSKNNDGPGAPSPVSSEPTASSPSSGTPAAPPQTVTPGVTVEVLESNFSDDRCTQLTDPKYAGVAELFHKVKLTNSSGEDIYSKVAIFHSDKAGCGATGENPGGLLGLVSGDTAIGNGKSGTATYHFPIDDRQCGRFQLDDTWRPTNTFVIGKVIDTGHDCPSCEAFDVQLTVTGEGLTRTVSVTFKGQKPSKKAHVDFGDGTSADLANGGSVSHTWAYGEFIVKATLDSEGIQCFKSVTVKNEKPCEVQWIELKPEITYGEWGECKPNTDPTAQNGESKCSQSRSVRTVIKEQNSCTGEVRVKSDKTTTESRPCECKKDSCDNYDKPVITGSPATELSATQLTVKPGSVAPSGGTFNPTLPKSYNRPDYGEPAGEWEVTYTLSYGPPQLECSVRKEFEGKVPPKDDPCAQIPAPVVSVSCTPNPYYDQAVECTATSSVPATFAWDIDPLAASTVQSCSTTNKKSYSKNELDNKSWKVSVTATACDECKKTGTKSVDLIVNPPVGACYYKVSGESEADKEVTCTHTKGGYGQVYGVWLNFDHGQLSNHCMFPVNGLSNNKFQLTPGQSDPSCLNKND